MTKAKTPAPPEQNPPPNKQNPPPKQNPLPEQTSVVFNDTIKIAAYGRYGSRKTLQVGNLIQLVGADNVKVISAEHGLGTIRSVVDPGNVIIVSNVDETRKAWATCREWVEARIKARNSLWIAIDGGSQIMEWVANEQFTGADTYFEMKSKGIEPPDRLKPFGRYMSDRGNIDPMKIYGRIGRDSENLLSAWIGLPANLYVNYLEDMTQSNGYEKTIPWGPDVPGKVGLRSVMSSFDFVFRLAFNPESRLTAYLNPASNVYLARTREDRTLVKLPLEMVDFNLADFVQLVTSVPETKPEPETVVENP